MHTNMALAYTHAPVHMQTYRHMLLHTCKHVHNNLENESMLSLSLSRTQTLKRTSVHKQTNENTKRNELYLFLKTTSINEIHPSLSKNTHTCTSSSTHTHKAHTQNPNTSIESPKTKNKHTKTTKRYLFFALSLAQGHAQTQHTRIDTELKPYERVHNCI